VIISFPTGVQITHTNNIQNLIISLPTECYIGISFDRTLVSKGGILNIIGRDLDVSNIK